MAAVFGRTLRLQSTKKAGTQRSFKTPMMLDIALNEDGGCERPGGEAEQIPLNPVFSTGVSKGCHWTEATHHIGSMSM